jgi:hypothetical protein
VNSTDEVGEHVKGGNTNNVEWECITAGTTGRRTTCRCSRR